MHTNTGQARPGKVPLYVNVRSRACSCPPSLLNRTRSTLPACTALMNSL